MIAPPPASLHFRGFEVSRFLFDRSSRLTEGDFTVNIQATPQFSTDDKTSFQAILIITINAKDDADFNLQVQALGDFAVTGEIDENLYNSFLTINAPAIIYPYIRAFISNVTVQSGMKPITLPPVNFVARAINNQSSDELDFAKHE